MVVSIQQEQRGVLDFTICLEPKTLLMDWDSEGHGGPGTGGLDSSIRYQLE